MRHGKAGRKLGRNAPHRRAMLRNLAANVVLHGEVVTTEAKAKELRRFLEPMITKAVRLAKQAEATPAQKLHVVRELRKDLPLKLVRTSSATEQEEVYVVKRVVDELGPRYAKRAEATGQGGGYLSLIKLGFRRGDAAPLTRVALVAGDNA